MGPIIGKSMLWNDDPDAYVIIRGVISASPKLSDMLATRLKARNSAKLPSVFFIKNVTISDCLTKDFIL